MSPSGSAGAGRAIVVGHDPELAAALHLELRAAGWELVFAPEPDGLEELLDAAPASTVVLLLPAAPDASWGTALMACASAAGTGLRVLMIAPEPDVVWPLAAVAGAETVLSRAEALARPGALFQHAPGLLPLAPPPRAPPSAPPARSYRTPPALPTASLSAPALGGPSAGAGTTGRHGNTRPAISLALLIDEELVDEPRNRPRPTRVEVDVSLVSEHHFYVGATRRVDSGGLFIATALAPPVGTSVQVRLGLADGRKLELQGEVTFVREKGALGGRQPAGCGVQLHGLPSWAGESIARFLQARPPMVWSPGR